VQRPAFFHPEPRCLIATGIAWLLYGAYLIVMSWAEWVQEPGALGTLVWPALGLAALIAGLDLVAARPFSRGLVVFLAGLGLVGTVAFLSTLTFPSIASWWHVVVLAVVFLWSVIVVAVL
jgi:hypothetical protein